MDVQAIAYTAPLPQPPTLTAATGALFQAVTANLASSAYEVQLTIPVPVDTTLLQAEYPAPVVDTTILQAEVDAGMAVAPEEGTVAPALPMPLAAPVANLESVATGTPLPGEPSLTSSLVALAAPEPGTEPAPAPLTPSFQNPQPLPVEALPTVQPPPLDLVAGPPPDFPNPSPDAMASTQVQADVAQETSRQLDLQTDDLIAEAAMILQAQQTVLAALKSGAGDVALLLSGLPPGATATLLGGGWVRVPPGTEPSHTEALWAFQFPFYNVDIPAVTSSTRANPTRDEGTRGGVKSQPLTAYGPRGEKEAQPGQPFASTLDILD